jgi:triacylglycerol lipase
MNFSVLPPEVNSVLLVDGPGSVPMLEAAAAWDGIASELSSAANTFSSVTSDLAVEAWQGPASVSMANATAPYASWLGAAATQAEESASQAQAAAAAFEAARTAMVEPALVTANRAQFVSLVISNLFGQNAPVIAAAEAAYEQMWAQAVSVMTGYHTSSSAAVAQLESWAHVLENLPGLPGQIARAIANASAVVQQEVQQTANKIALNIFGSPASAPIPATQNPTYTGTPSLITRVEVGALYLEENVTGFFGINLITTLAPIASSPIFAGNPILSLLVGTTPPKILTALLGETVHQSTYDGMNVVQITPAHPSGEYVVAIHGGAFVLQPSIFHWLDYTLMAYQTGATIEVPIYPLIQQGGTAGTVVPEMAGLISTQIALHGAANVSVLGDSAGGTIALSAVELMVSQGDPVPRSMVLFSPVLDVSMTNPNISLISDPLLGAPSGQLGREWAGNLPVKDPLVSPLYGSLTGLPPTTVYSGSLEILAPDTLVLAQEAATQNAPISFVLRAGEFHDWPLLDILGATGYRPQIYQELGI